MQIKTPLTLIFIKIWSTLLLLNVLMLLYFMPRGVEMISDASGKQDIVLLDIMHFGFSRLEAYETLNAMGEAGRKHYINFHQGVDFAFPFFYGSFLALTVILLLKKLRIKTAFKAILVAIPLLAMMADLTENLHIVRLTIEFPDFSSLNLVLASAGNIIKWGTITISLAIIATLLILNIKLKVQRSESKIT